MVRKANIIKHLRMMGYSITNGGGLVIISLTTSSGFEIRYVVSDEEIIYGECVVERIVSRINELIVKAF